MDAEIYEVLREVYSCKIEKVALLQNRIEVERKKKIGVKKKVLGIFPIYEYERWTETLSKWSYRSIKFKNIFGKPIGSINIAICYDVKGNTLYWRYC